LVDAHLRPQKNLFSLGNALKQSEFVRWLNAQGVVVIDGGKHLKLYHLGHQSTLPRHPSKELKKGLVEGVKKQLNLK